MYYVIDESSYRIDKTSFASAEEAEQRAGEASRILGRAINVYALQAGELNFAFRVMPDGQVQTENPLTAPQAGGEQIEPAAPVALGAIFDEVANTLEAAGKVRLAAAVDGQRTIAANPKKQMAQHMWVLSKDSAGGYLVTIGDPKKSGSKIKERFSGPGAKNELKTWVKLNVGKNMSPDHTLDLTGMKLVPDIYSDFYLKMKGGASADATDAEIVRWISDADKHIQKITKEKEPEKAFMQRHLGYTKGKKFYRVFIESVDKAAKDRSAYCFIDMDGNIYKSASWKAPAKGIRGHIKTTDPKSIDQYTSWLYRR